MPSTRDLMALSRGRRGMTSLDGHAGGDWAADFREQAGTVTEDDLRGLGLPMGATPMTGGMREGVDPEALAFNALRAAAQVKTQGGGAGARAHVADLKSQADLAKAGVSEVLRRRQGDFNTMAATAKPGASTPLVGSAPDPRLTALTGAAVASQMRGGAPDLEMPEARRPMSIGQQAQANPFQFNVAADRASMAQGAAADTAATDARYTAFQTEQAAKRRGAAETARADYDAVQAGPAIRRARTQGY